MSSRKGNRKRPTLRRMVQKEISKNLETKEDVAQYAAVTIGDVASGLNRNYSLVDIAQGTGQQQRIGNSVMCTGAHIRLGFKPGSLDELMRVIIYSPKDVSQTLTSTSVETLVDLDQFNILYDRVWAMGSTGQGGVSSTINLSFTRGGRKGRKLGWSGSGATTYTQGPLFMYIVSTKNGATYPTFTGSHRLFYKDG